MLAGNPLKPAENSWIKDIPKTTTELDINIIKFTKTFGKSFWQLITLTST